MRSGRRGVAGVVLVAVLGTVTACGEEKRTALPGPDATAPPAPPSTAVIPPTPYDRGFEAMAQAADAVPALAQRLAGGLVAAGRVRGAADSPAAALRAKLTYRLTLHVHLFGLAATSVLDSGPDGERTKAALEAVDINSRALAKLIPASERTTAPSAKPTGRAADDDAVSDVARRSPDFLIAWRTHVDDLAAFALAAREGIEPDKADVRRDLDTWRAAAASSLKQVADGQVRSATLRGQLGRYTKAITNAMSAMADKDGTGPERLRNAAEAMNDVAESLGNGLARAADLDGDARDAAADVRADLTRLLTEHVVMTGATALASYTNRKAGSASSPEAQIARLGLDENSKALAERLRPAADPRTQVQFLQLWRTTVNDFLDYAEAVRTGDTTRSDAEVKALDSQRKAIATFLAGVAKDKGAASALSAALRTHIANLTGAIRALKVELAPPA